VSAVNTILSKKIYESIEDTTTAEADNSPVCFPMITHCKEFGSAVYRYHILKMHHDVIHEKALFQRYVQKITEYLSVLAASIKALIWPVICPTILAINRPNS